MTKLVAVVTDVMFSPSAGPKGRLLVVVLSNVMLIGHRSRRSRNSSCTGSVRMSHGFTIKVELYLVALTFEFN